MCLLAKEWKSKLLTKSYEIGNFYHTASTYCAEHAVLNLTGTNKAETWPVQNEDTSIQYDFQILKYQYQYSTWRILTKYQYQYA